MSAHRISDDFNRLLSTSGNVIADPGSGGTFDLAPCPMFGIATIASGTRKLPDNMPLGTVFSVYATGAVTITNVAGTTVATLAAEEIGEFKSKTSTTWVAHVDPVGAIEINTAADLPIADSGSYTTTATVEAALQSLLRDTQVIDVPLSAFFDADGDPLVKFADNASPNPGINLANSEALGLRWNNNATQNQPVLASVLVPTGAAGSVMTLHVLASKTGATVGDATTFTVTAFENSTGALHDAGSDIGGVTSAMTGDATAKTVQHVTLALNNMEGTAPAALTFTITPTSGTLGTDDVVVERVWFSYSSNS